ncbi:MAG: glycosyltransferase, partial [Bowdeniella nasicola]|nr:glycosyltransferase [Bowdeniella nasicola]
DDSAPGPNALARLLREVELATSIGLVGCKQRGWAKPDRLLSVGIRATKTTRRFIECDPEDIDQGQLDARRDVLGVGSAGALIRKDIFTAVGGFDPALGPFNDGLELSRRVRLAGYRVVVVPTAVVQHARASYQGLRSAKTRRPDISRSFRARRQAQLFTWISGVAAWQVPLVWLAIAILAPLRALWRLARKDIDLLWAELHAASAVLFQPASWLNTRRRTRAVATISRATLATIYTPARLISEKKREQRRSARDYRRLALAPSELERKELARLARYRRATMAVVALALFALGIAIIRPALSVGIYAGGSLARAVGNFADTFHAATSQWIDTGLGIAGPPEPFLFALLPAVALSGNLAVFVPLLYWFAIPLAGMSAWFGAGAGTRSLPLRGWAAVIWALAPVYIGALRDGRLGVVIAHLLLPLLMVALARSVNRHARDTVVSGMVGAKRVDAKRAAERRGEYREGTQAAKARNRADNEATPTPEVVPEVGPREPAEETTAIVATSSDPQADAVATAQAADVDKRGRLNLAAAASAALLFAAITAAAPSLLPVGIALLWVSQLVIAHHRLAFLLIPLPALVLQLPQLLTATQPYMWRAFFLSPGYPLRDTTDVLAAAGGGELPTGFGTFGAEQLGIVIAVIFAVLAGLALARGGRTTIMVRLGWLLIVAGLSGVIVARTVVVGSDHDGAITAATGPFVSLIIAGLICAIVLAGDGLGQITATWWKGARLATLGGLGLALVAIPLVWASIAIQSGATGLVSASKRPITPALSQQLAAGEGGERTLVLTATGTDRYHGAVVHSDGETMLASPSVVALRELAHPGDPAHKWLRETVAASTAGFDETIASRLATAGIGVVVVPPVSEFASDLPPAVHSQLVAALDATAGLARVTENDAGTIWRVSTAADGGGLASFAQLIDGQQPTLVPVTDSHIDTKIAAGGSERKLVLATPADHNWHASYDGHALDTLAAGWQQAFAVPAHAGSLEVTYRPAYLPWWQAGLAIVMSVTVLLAIPLRRRGEE